jgi:hypothetical protein
MQRILTILAAAVMAFGIAAAGMNTAGRVIHDDGLVTSIVSID